jgi:predicted pyridoxine 5'-phosphate oxidase superfamily flavin-nucleotide-binding protein
VISQNNSLQDCFGRPLDPKKLHYKGGQAMAKLTEEMKALITAQQAYVGTATPDGRPNIALKGSARIIDDEHLAFFEMAGGKTWANIQRNPAVVIAVANPSKMQGYRFEGKAAIVTTGPLYDEAKKLAEMMKIPVPPKAAIVIKIEEIFDLGKGGAKVA